MTEQLGTSAAAIAALLERVDEWWDYDHGNIFKDVANLLPALSAELTALRAERDELAAAIDSVEASNGLTSNGNLWRFWFKRAQIVAEKYGSMKAERDAALARVGVLENIRAEAKNYLSKQKNFDGSAPECIFLAHEGLLAALAKGETL